MNTREMWRDYSRLHMDNPRPDSEAKVAYYAANSGHIKSGQKGKVDYAIVVPAWREEVLIARCLAGINQAIGVAANLGVMGRLIVVDNDAKKADATGEIAKYFGTTVVEQPKLGWGLARQAGLETTIAAEKIVMTTDADILVYGEWAQSFLAAFKFNPNLVLGYGELEHDFDFPPALKVRILRAVMGLGKAPLKMLRSCKIEKYGGGSGNMAFLRAEAQSVGGYNEPQYGEDTRLWKDIEKKHGLVDRVPNALAIHSKRRVEKEGMIGNNIFVAVNTLLTAVGLPSIDNRAKRYEVNVR